VDKKEVISRELLTDSGVNQALSALGSDGAASTGRGFKGGAPRQVVEEESEQGKAEEGDAEDKTQEQVHQGALEAILSAAQEQHARLNEQEEKDRRKQAPAEWQTKLMQTLTLAPSDDTATALHLLLIERLLACFRRLKLANVRPNLAPKILPALEPELASLSRAPPASPLRWRALSRLAAATALQCGLQAGEDEVVGEDVLRQDDARTCAQAVCEHEDRLRRRREFLQWVDGRKGGQGGDGTRLEVMEQVYLVLGELEQAAADLDSADAAARSEAFREAVQAVATILIAADPSMARPEVEGWVRKELGGQQSELCTLLRRLRPSSLLHNLRYPELHRPGSRATITSTSASNNKTSAGQSGASEEHPAEQGEVSEAVDKDLRQVLLQAAYHAAKEHMEEKHLPPPDYDPDSPFVQAALEICAKNPSHAPSAEPEDQRIEMLRGLAEAIVTGLPLSWDDKEATADAVEQDVNCRAVLSALQDHALRWKRRRDVMWTLLETEAYSPTDETLSLLERDSEVQKSFIALEEALEAKAGNDHDEARLAAAQASVVAAVLQAAATAAGRSKDTGDGSTTNPSPSREKSQLALANPSSELSQRLAQLQPRAKRMWTRLRGARRVVTSLVHHLPDALSSITAGAEPTFALEAPAQRRHSSSNLSGVRSADALERMLSSNLANENASNGLRESTIEAIKQALEDRREVQTSGNSPDTSTVLADPGVCGVLDRLVEQDGDGDVDTNACLRELVRVVADTFYTVLDREDNLPQAIDDVRQDPSVQATWAALCDTAERRRKRRRLLRQVIRATRWRQHAPHQSELQALQDLEQNEDVEAAMRNAQDASPGADRAKQAVAMVHATLKVLKTLKEKSNDPDDPNTPTSPPTAAANIVESNPELVDSVAALKPPSHRAWAKLRAAFQVVPALQQPPSPPNAATAANPTTTIRNGVSQHLARIPTVQKALRRLAGLAKTSQSSTHASERQNLIHTILTAAEKHQQQHADQDPDLDPNAIASVPHAFQILGVGTAATRAAFASDIDTFAKENSHKTKNGHNSVLGGANTTAPPHHAHHIGAATSSSCPPLPPQRRHAPAWLDDPYQATPGVERTVLEEEEVQRVKRVMGRLVG